MNVNTNVPAWACPYCEMNQNSSAKLRSHLDNGCPALDFKDEPPVEEPEDDFYFPSPAEWVAEDPISDEDFEALFPKTREPMSPLMPPDVKPVFQNIFDDIFDEAFGLLIERQKKYGPENIEEQGIYGVFTRMRDDKMSRISRSLQGSIVDGKAVVEVANTSDAADTFEDACIDIANYALIMLALYRGLWGAPLYEEYE